MQSFTRLLLIIGLLLTIGTAYYGSMHGVGLNRLNDPQRLAQAGGDSTHISGSRSYFLGRTVRGGGPRYGK